LNKHKQHLKKQTNKQTKVKATKGSPGTRAPYQKGNLSQQRANSSSKLIQETDSFSKHGAAEKSTGSKNLSAMRSLAS
jgi:hypothetical protein